MRYLVILLLAFSRLALAYHTGDTLANLCWKDAKEQTLCLDDAKEEIRVLIYGMERCGNCTAELAELVPRLSEVAGKPVAFISLLVFNASGQSPTAADLEKWRLENRIPFVVVRAPYDELSAGANAHWGFPTIFIVDTHRKLDTLTVGHGPKVVDELFGRIRELLQQH